MSENEVCSICMNEIQDEECFITLSCQHKYHFDCCQQASQHSMKCCLCRKRTIPNFMAIFPTYVSIPVPEFRRSYAYVAIDDILQNINDESSVTDDSENT